jgi:hypothetical protein
VEGTRGGDGEVAEAGAFVQGDDRVVEVLEEEQRAALLGGLEVFDRVGPGSTLDIDGDVALDEEVHAGLERGDLLGADDVVVVEVMEEAGADGHAGHQAPLGEELLGGDGEEEAERAAVGGRALGGVEGDGLDDAIGEDGGIERHELVVDEDRGEGPGKRAQLADYVLGLDPGGIGHLFAGRIGDRDLLHGLKYN